MDSFHAYVLDQLRGVDGVTVRRMFGGAGLFYRETMFGIIHGGRLYLKTDVETRAGYVARGMPPFQPNARMTSKRYYEVPADILEDADELTEWARRARSAAEA